MVVLNDIGLTLEIFGFGIFLFVPIMESFGFSQEKLPRIQEFFYQHKSLERGLRYGGILLIISGLLLQYSFLN